MHCCTEVVHANALPTSWTGLVLHLLQYHRSGKHVRLSGEATRLPRRDLTLPLGLNLLGRPDKIGALALLHLYHGHQVGPGTILHNGNFPNEPMAVTHHKAQDPEK